MFLYRFILWVGFRASRLKLVVEGSRIGSSLPFAVHYSRGYCETSVPASGRLSSGERRQGLIERTLSNF